MSDGTPTLILTLSLTLTLIAYRESLNESSGAPRAEGKQDPQTKSSVSSPCFPPRLSFLTPFRRPPPHLKDTY